LEERVGERRPILGAAARANNPAGRRTYSSGGLAANDNLLSLPLSSKGGEGNSTVDGEHRDACEE
jgi:hypothetical protein